MYKRKTRDRYDIETNWGYGWEVECSEYTYSEARQRLREYRDNSYGSLSIPLLLTVCKDTLMKSYITTTDLIFISLL